MLVDWQIENLVQKQNVITPYDKNQLQPNSYDVCLDKHIKILNVDSNNEPIDIYQQNFNIWKDFIMDSNYIVQPNECILCSTMEYVNIPSNICAVLEGKSSIGRWFITIHSTAGYIDGGFKGNITCELKNNFSKPIILFPGMTIGQLVFYETEHCRNPYNGKYQNQDGVTESKYWLNSKSD